MRNQLRSETTVKFWSLWKIFFLKAPQGHECKRVRSFLKPHQCLDKQNEPCWQMRIFDSALWGNVPEKSGAIDKSNNLYWDRLKDFKIYVSAAAQNCTNQTNTPWISCFYLVYLQISIGFWASDLDKSTSQNNVIFRLHIMDSRKHLKFHMIVDGGVSNARLRASLQSKRAV